MPKPVVIKKYGNRRLYDTEESRYLTMEELATKIREGTDVTVVEAKTGADLTQATLTQIVIESRGAARFLPVPLLMQMIRLGDDALAEFIGQYMTGAMELYLRTKQGMQAMSPFGALGAALPFPAEAFSRFFTNPFSQAWGHGGATAPMATPEVITPTPPPDDAEEASAGELAELRKELEELKDLVGKKKPRRRRKSE